jgi:hypothetical protein
MIDRHTIKFDPPVSQKELEKALHESAPEDIMRRVGSVKCRIEVIGDFEDIKKLSELLKELNRKDSS